MLHDSTSTTTHPPRAFYSATPIASQSIALDVRSSRMARHRNTTRVYRISATYRPDMATAVPFNFVHLVYGYSDSDSGKSNLRLSAPCARIQ